jgi:hypothetical protein
MGALVSRARQQAAQTTEQVVVQGQQCLAFTVTRRTLSCHYYRRVVQL